LHTEDLDNPMELASTEVPNTGSMCKTGNFWPV